MLVKRIRSQLLGSDTDRHTHVNSFPVFSIYITSHSQHPQRGKLDALILQRRKLRLREVPCPGEERAIAVDALCKI